MFSMELNWMAVGLGTLAWMIMGMIWYNPKVMGTTWMEHTGMTMEVLEARIESGEHNMGLAMGSSMVGGLVMNLVLAMVVLAVGGSAIEIAGLLALGFMMTDVGAYGFEGRTWKLYLIDKGWMVIAALIAGLLHTYL